MERRRRLCLIYVTAIGYLFFSSSVRYRTCYAVKVDDVVVDTRLYVYPTITSLQSRFNADSGTDGLLDVTILEPLNNRVSITYSLVQ